jgi:hypothetical protein
MGRELRALFGRGFGVYWFRLWRGFHFDACSGLVRLLWHGRVSPSLSPAISRALTIKLYHNGFRVAKKLPGARS